MCVPACVWGRYSHRRRATMLLQALVYVRVCVCLCLRVHVHVCVCAHACVCVCVSAPACVCVQMCVCVGACTVCVCVCVCVCVHGYECVWSHSNSNAVPAWTGRTVKGNVKNRPSPQGGRCILLKATTQTTLPDRSPSRGRGRTPDRTGDALEAE